MVLLWSAHLCSWCARVRVLPCPFTEGKTARGQLEMFQLYHRISVPRKAFRSRERPSDFGRADVFTQLEPIAKVNHSDSTYPVTGLCMP